MWEIIRRIRAFCDQRVAAQNEFARCPSRAFTGESIAAALRRCAAISALRLSASFVCKCMQTVHRSKMRVYHQSKGRSPQRPPARSSHARAPSKNFNLFDPILAGPSQNRVNSICEAEVTASNIHRVNENTFDARSHHFTLVIAFVS